MKLTESDLEGFTGTESYYKHASGMLYTDGIKFLAENAEAYWLLDLVASYQREEKVKKEGFQTWELVKKENNEAVITLEDGNNNKILSQKIPYTDFPLAKVEVWLIDGVLILPSEY